MGPETDFEKTGVKQRNMPVENLHLQQFRSASLIINSSHLRMDLKKMKEVFVFWYVRNKSLFQFSKLSFHLLRIPSGNFLVNAENRVFSAETGCYRGFAARCENTDFVAQNRIFTLSALRKRGFVASFKISLKLCEICLLNTW